jgi:hypothetical protein
MTVNALPVKSAASDAKSILLSKVFWANLLAPVFLFITTKWGIVLDPNTQTIVIFIIMGLVNIILRYFTTQPVSLTLPKLN